MKVVLFGATGMIGTRILKELVSRGHQVTAVVRDPSRVEANPAVKVVKGDVFDASSAAAAAKGADVAVSAYGPGAGNPYEVVDATKSLIEGVSKAGVKRFIEVGGAGSLLVAPNLRLVDAPNFPAEYKEIALAHADALEVLRGADLDWTYLSPAAIIEPGERTGKFRLGADNLVADEQGNSRISAEDYAIALVDEIEKPQHIRKRFTLAY
jgi:putative NADH-flavin reductase